MFLLNRIDSLGPRASFQTGQGNRTDHLICMQPQIPEKGHPMPTFMAIIVASLAAWLVNQAFADKGLMLLRVLLDLVVWFGVFYLTRRFLSTLRPRQ
jgi:hypothetical protein